MRSISQILQNAAIKQPKSKATSALVFLHGLGDTGHGWCDILSEMDIPKMKIICPTAPHMPVTLNGGMRMPAWFDVFHLGEGKRYDEEGLTKASSEVHTLLESEVLEGIDPSRIFLGGFSMGGALAVYSSYTHSKDLAGIVALSCWLPADKSALLSRMKSNKTTPVLQCHGDADPTVKYEGGVMTSELIKSFNPKNHEFKTFRGMGHSFCPGEISDIKDFITRLIPPEGKM